MDEKERQYREYLKLRQQNNEGGSGSGVHHQTDDKFGEYFAGNTNRSKPQKKSIENTPYGGSDFRKRQLEKKERDREMREYLAARDADRQRHGGKAEARDATKAAKAKTGKRHGKAMAKNDAYETTEKSTAKAMRKLNKKNRKGGKLKRRVSVLMVCVIGVGAVVVAGIVMALGILGSVQNIPIDENNIGIDTAVASQLEGYKNIAILGIDARADEDDSNARSDAIIVASINEESDEIKLFSVYRDTFLDIGDEGYDKITHAYYFGGAQQTLHALNKNLDLNIDDVVVINWKTVADTIDSVGGIEIDVQESEIEEMNKYIPNTAKNTDGPSDLIEAPGKQTLNGVQAVTYSRIRKDAATGDYRRNERMKIVFAETFKEVKEAGFLKMFSVAKNVAPEVRTDMSSADILGLMIKFKSYEMKDDTTGFPYEVGSWTGQGAAGVAWFGPPKDLAANVSKLHKQFFDQDSYVPTDTVQSISDEISYRTGIY